MQCNLQRNLRTDCHNDATVLWSKHAAYEFYLTDKDPKHGVLVDIGRKGFAKDEFETTDDMTAELENIIQDCLPEGFKRFEAIMASGIKGNELKF